MASLSQVFWFYRATDAELISWLSAARFYLSELRDHRVPTDAETVSLLGQIICTPTGDRMIEEADAHNITI